MKLLGGCGRPATSQHPPPHTGTERLWGFLSAVSLQGEGREVLQKGNAFEEGGPESAQPWLPCCRWVSPGGSQPSTPAWQKWSWTGAKVLWDPSLQLWSGLCPSCLLRSDCPMLGLAESFGTERFLPLGESLSLNEKYFDENT